MLYSGALNNMLIRGFEEQYEKEGYYPAVIVSTGVAESDTFEEQTKAVVDDLEAKIGLPFVNHQYIFSANGSVYT
ncbi:MAG: hypothetical protein J5786_03295, partial [Clostridiales bacterium]|nr:hypothetical protein [Clostridiales bacterium]